MLANHRRNNIPVSAADLLCWAEWFRAIGVEWRRDREDLARASRVSELDVERDRRVVGRPRLTVVTGGR